jgi:hypothetical protein
MAPVLVSYFATGLVERMPTWVFSLVLMLISFLVFTAGLILDSLSRARAEQLRIHYMNLPQRSQQLISSEAMPEVAHLSGTKSAA